MRRIGTALSFALLAAAVAIVERAPSAARADDGDPPRERHEQVRVLFIGNSFTRMHDLPRAVRRIAESDTARPPIRVSRETRPGATLRRHWMRRIVRWRIQSGAYTHVVLQDHSMRAIDRPEELATYARRFDEVIVGAGARTVLYTPWARRRNRGPAGRALGSSDALQTRIDSVYDDVASEIDADVAPVGGAWLLAEARLPGVRLYGRDGIHPSPEGTYLAACVLYGVLTHRDPTATGWTPWPMTRRTGTALRTIAAESLEATGITLEGGSP